MAALCLASALLLATSGCARGLGQPCNQSSSCEFGLACVFQDVVVVDCCAVRSDGTLNCDPAEVEMAPDCEFDSFGRPIPRYRRVSCLRDAFDRYRIWEEMYATIPCSADDDCIDANCDLVRGLCQPTVIPIGLNEDLTNTCVCEAGATFIPDPSDPDSVYDPVLPAGLQTPVCPRSDAPANTEADADVNSCPPAAAYPPTCDNGTVEVLEECEVDSGGDPVIRGTATCEARCPGTSSGDLACDAACEIDCTGCM